MPIEPVHLPLPATQFFGLVVFCGEGREGKPEVALTRWMIPMSEFMTISAVLIRRKFCLVLVGSTCTPPEPDIAHAKSGFSVPPPWGGTRLI